MNSVSMHSMYKVGGRVYVHAYIKLFPCAYTWVCSNNLYTICNYCIGSPPPICLGLISRQEGDIQGSLELFRKAVKLNPNSAASVKQVARSMYVQVISASNNVLSESTEIFHLGLGGIG